MGFGFSVGRWTSCYLCTESTGLRCARRVTGPCWNFPGKFSLFSVALTLSERWSNRHTVQNVLQTLPSLSLCHTHFREKKNKAFAQLHGSSDFVRCRVNTETGEALVLHQRAQSLCR